MLTAVSNESVPSSASTKPSWTSPPLCDCPQGLQTPKALTKRVKWKKGVIHYIRHNFWPLRSFTDLFDLRLGEQLERYHRQM